MLKHSCIDCVRGEGLIGFQAHVAAIGVRILWVSLSYAVHGEAVITYCRWPTIGSYETRDRGHILSKNLGLSLLLPRILFQSIESTGLQGLVLSCNVKEKCR